MNAWLLPKAMNVLGVLLLSLNLTTSARFVPAWSDAELQKASDLIVVGRPIAVRDLDETNSLGYTSSATFQSRFRGVETTFKVSNVLQGRPESDQIVLHHYREEWGTPPNGPCFISLTPNGSGEYVLYLVRDGTNRYAPATGQVDAWLSIKSRPTELPSRQNSALELIIETPESVVKSSEGISFTISFHNHSTNNLLLNGGELLGNGSEIWSSLEAELKTETGRRVPITLGWGVPGVAGRIYFLGVPLRAGSGYTLSVNPHDYLVGNGERLEPGRYEIRFIYRGRQSPYRDSTQMPACWESEVYSNTLKIQVRD